MLKEKKLRIINVCACVLLVVILVALQYLPYWTFIGEETGENTISISDYLWHPNEENTNEFEDMVKAEVFEDTSMTDHVVVNEIVMFPAWAFGIAVAAFALILLNRKSMFIPASLTIVAAIVSLVSYLMNPVLAISESWTIHVVVCGVVLVVGIALLVFNILSSKKEKKAAQTSIAG